MADLNSGGGAFCNEMRYDFGDSFCFIFGYNWCIQFWWFFLYDL